MKTPHSFSRNHFLSSVRFAIAVTLMSAAAAMAFVAAKHLARSYWGIRQYKSIDQQIQTGRDQVAATGEPCLVGKQIAGQWPQLKKLCDRAYPASDIPFKLTVNAQKAWAK